MSLYKSPHLLIVLFSTFIFITSCTINPFEEQAKGSKHLNRNNSIPEPIGFVSDFENIYSSSEKKILDSVIMDYNKRVDIQIALATFDSSMVKRDSFQSYTQNLANKWGVGEKGKYNGLFICICKGYRYMYIHNGYGTEKRVTDSETRAIIVTAFTPEFKKGNFYQGTLNGLKALMMTLRNK